ncbi:MAG: hypothetical protein JWQ27_1804 [Ferruginibacter sp.]|nr:hypothetical protein [Ferruginibacter sp.]
MKKILIPVLLFLASSASAQLNNSWIDYSKTYYKFRLAQDSLCRLTQPALVAAGLGSVNADHFQLWRNGQQIRLYTSVSNAALGAADYIEFWGERNDGKADKPLYRDPAFQLADKYSLSTDTAAYFLTVNPSGGNFRFTNAANTAPSAATPEPYFMRKVDMYFNNQLNKGNARTFPEYVYSSSYDLGEGWTSADVAPNFDLVHQFSGLNVYTAGPANSLSVRVNAFGNAPNARNLRVRLFNNIVYDAAMPYFSDAKVNLTNLPLTLLQNPNFVPLYVVNNSAIPANNNITIPNDRLVVATIGLTYPATFNFNAQKSFEFELPAAPSGNYLVIDNFNYGSVAPVLYDRSENRRYVGDIASTPGKVKFVLPASAVATRRFFLVNQETSFINQVGGLSSKTFINFATAAAQGDYMIISNKLLFNDGSGVNQVDQYRIYRSSIAGGSFNAKIYDIDELTDQFAFGIKRHPASVRDFVRYADQNFGVRPKYVLLMGRGMTYLDQRVAESNPLSNQLNLVPSFGWPASDVLLVSEPGTVLPIVPVGRIGAINGGEIAAYLNKVKEYELNQKVSSPSIADRGWMKNVLHVAGGRDTSENISFRQYMSGYEQIVRDSAFGGNVETFSKTSTGAVQQANSSRIEQLFNEGLSFIGYFGHSSANTFEFNLSNPEIYHNQGKYPFFNVSGCSAGNFYIYDPLRLTGNLSLSEKYVLAPNRGSIAFLADSHYGIPPFLDFYNTEFYTNFARTLYGGTVGNQMKQGISDLGGANSGLDYHTRIHLEEIALHGDPAIRINSFSKPDYAIEDPQVLISPNIISVADNNFHIKVKMLNIGKVVNDSIWVSIKRKLPNDSIKVLFDGMIPGIKYADSLEMDVAINPLTDKGLNKLLVAIDYTNRVDELFEQNNNISKDFYVFEDELRPSSPYNYSIVNQQNISFYANTANPLGSVRQYMMEIDTTELFNSSFKKVYSATGPGGIVQFTPSNLTFTDSTVYYWRVATVPTGTANYIWNNFSFVYLPNSSQGFNQSHYYQNLKSTYQNINLGTDRKYKFDILPRNLIFRTGLYPYYIYDKINVNLDFTPVESYGCKYNSLQFYVFDSATLSPWINQRVGTQGRFGSWPPDCDAPAAPTRKFFEFPYTDPVYRKNAMDFIDQIPTGMFVAITNLGMTSNSSFISTWQNDQATLGAGNSLYHKLKSIGFTQIDSFTRNLPFLFFFKKGIPSYTPTQVIGPADSTYIDQTFTIETRSVNGSIESPVYGPAKKWTSLHWRGSSNDAGPVTDSVTVEVTGIRLDGTRAVLATVSPSQDTSLSFIDARTYPYLKLKVFEQDRVNITPYQLRYLRVNADYVPEGAVAPNILFSMRDTVDQGEPLNVRLAFKNISQTSFDSLLRVKLIITDKQNVPHVVELPKRKSLQVGDTLIVNYTIDTRNYPGNNTLFIDVNPDNDQLEQYHYNNVLYKDFFVKEDRFNPLLDVTFDGVHILNKDIVASRPGILVKLKDESKFLALKDTALLKVQVRFPDQSLHDYHFGGDTMRFIPANLSAGENTASIEFKPYFPQDGEYELIVTGKDVNGNKAGELEYHVSFTVINKPMISNLLNYPNPFTTSTAFVFTVTGTEVPQNMRIQILTITGKVVREITKDELGPIHVGRNITEFKWDGTDMYGQKLANGVYIYRVLTNLNGKSLDKYRATGDETDKFFNKGYGKMYLMR